MASTILVQRECSISSDSSVNSNSEFLTSEAAPVNMGPQFRSTSVQDSGIFVIHVDAGQDIISRLVSFCQTHNRITLIVSAFGHVSSPSILSCNRCFTYEGNYPIISLDGFLNPINAGGVNTSTLSLSMPGADGSLIGGRISNSLIAASQTIVVLGIFGPMAPVPHSSDLAPAPQETNDDSDATSALSSTSTDK